MKGVAGPAFGTALLAAAVALALLLVGDDASPDDEPLFGRGIAVNENVTAWPVVTPDDERGVRLVDGPTGAEVVWFAGRTETVSMGDPVYDPGCKCEVDDIGYSRIVELVGNQELVVCLAQGLVPEWMAEEPVPRATVKPAPPGSTPSPPGPPVTPSADRLAVECLPVPAERQLSQ